jgi:hypothetical protein
MDAVKEGVMKLDVEDLIGTDWKTFLPQSYRIGFHHSWADYNAWSGHYFIETLSIPDDKSLYIDDARALCLSRKSIRGQSIDTSLRDIKLVYTAKDGSVYTYKQKLEWRLIMRENTRLQFLGRPSNVIEIQDLNGGSSFSVSYRNWHYSSIWNHMEPELSKKSLIGEVLGVVFELKEGNNVVGTAYYRPNYNDRLKYIIEMANSNFNYRKFSLMYSIAMNHAHPYGIRTDNTCRLYIH